MAHALENLPHVSKFQDLPEENLAKFSFSDWVEYQAKKKCQLENEHLITRRQKQAEKDFEDYSRHDGVSMRELYAARPEAGEERGGEFSELTSDGGAAGPLLESSHKQCDAGDGCISSRDEPQTEQTFELRPCRCKSWYCPDCCFINGMNLRRRLREVLETFEAVQMWTFTIDPQLFSDPRHAWDYVKEKRCIARVMRSLRKAGVLISDRYFYVVEWQKDTEMVHFHLLLESRHVPIDLVRREWSRFRPAWAGPPAPNRPPFGTVRFTKTAPFVDMAHAANYATKYLLKTPDHGFPDWVLDSKTYIRRYQTSRGFWPSRDESNGTNAEDVFQPTDKPKKESQLTLTPEEEETQQKEERSTIRERLAQCKQAASVIMYVRTSYPDGRVMDGTRHMMNLGFSFAECLAMLGFRDVDVSRLVLTRDQVRYLDREWLRAQKEGNSDGVS